jgi:4a-hydroxytetrahydrobiopterin dehydratase
MSSSWERVQTASGDALVKDFDCGDFKGSVAFLNAVLPLAEAADHHPDVTISWKTVTVTLSTHSEGGVTEKDFALSAQIDALPVGPSA